MLQWIQRALLFTGVGLLTYTALVFTDAWRFQMQKSRALDQAIESNQSVRASAAAPADDLPDALAGNAPRQPARIAYNRSSASPLIGRLEIPRLGVSAIVMQGTDTFTLRRAVGHLPATALPGEIGNAVLTAHRDTFFRPLKNIQEGDQIRLTTTKSQYLYRVVSISVIEPSNTAVVKSTGAETLTLVTCFPFSYIGPAPRRFVVRAERTLVDPGQVERDLTAARLEPQLH